MNNFARHLSFAAACSLALMGVVNLNATGLVVVRDGGALTQGDEKMGTDPILDDLKMTNPILEKMGTDPILEKLGGDPILSADFTF